MDDKCLAWSLNLGHLNGSVHLEQLLEYYYFSEFSQKKKKKNIMK